MTTETNAFITHQIYSVSDIQKHYAQKWKEKRGQGEEGGYWFDKGSMEFFNCKLDEQVYTDGKIFFFVSSEKGPDEIRRYSIRSYDPTTAEIETVGDFGQYSTKTLAKSAIKRFEGIQK